jgi:UDP-2,3-diacylglucosamine pyrophosphatase LpxH
MKPARVCAISDVHIDYQQNLETLVAFARQGHQSDVLLLAGDVSDRLERLQNLLQVLVECFSQVLFVPGNHELWVRRSGHETSLHKLDAIRALCDELGVSMAPVCVGRAQRVWLVPLLSWYDDKDCPEHSLFVEKDYARDRTDSLWSDFAHTRWPNDLTQSPAAWFAQANQAILRRQYDAPIISISHFLPRQELIFNMPVAEAMALGSKYDPMPEFNFSRVAGSQRIEQQIRQLGSRLHVYGHQHRNRQLEIDGVTYVSHCMGYPRERDRGQVPQEAVTPLCLWREDDGFLL